MSDTRILLGRIGRAQGLKGEVRLTSFTQNPVALGHYGPLESSDGKRSFVIESITARNDVVVAKFAGVHDRTAAEALVHQELWIAREKIHAATDEDEFLHADLIGCEVVTLEATVLGTVLDVPNYGAGDLLEVALAGGTKTLLIPFTKAFVTEIDAKARRIVVAPPDGLLEDT